MGEESKFQQRREFRKRGDISESSSEDQDSHSSSEAVFKKRKLVVTFRKSKEETKLGKSREVQCRGEKSARKGNDAKTSSYEPVLALDGLKTFTGSLLDDLKGTRENLLARMKDEMHKLGADGNIEAQKHSESRAKANRSVKSKEVPMGGGDATSALGSSVKANSQFNPSQQLYSNFGLTAHSQFNPSQQLYSNFGLTAQARNSNGQGDLDQVARSITATGKVREERSCLSLNPSESGIRFATPIESDIMKRAGVSVRPSISSNPSIHPDSSMYLTLPTDMSPYNYMQSRMSSSDQTIGASACRQYFPILQQEERFGKFHITQNSIAGYGYSTPSEASSDRDILSLRMSRGIVPGQYLPNSFSNHLNHGLESGLFPFRASSFPNQFHRNH